MERECFTRTQTGHAGGMSQQTLSSRILPSYPSCNFVQKNAGQESGPTGLVILIAALNSDQRIPARLLGRHAYLSVGRPACRQTWLIRTNPSAVTHPGAEAR